MAHSLASMDPVRKFYEAVNTGSLPPVDETTRKRYIWWILGTGVRSRTLPRTFNPWGPARIVASPAS